MEEQYVILQVRVLSSTHLKIKQIACEQGWSEEEMLRYLIHKGLATLQMEHVPTTDSHNEKELLRRLADCEGKYSAMKFKAFSLERDNQNLQFKVAGLEGSVAIWKSWAEQVKQRLYELSDENQKLRNQIDKTKIQDYVSSVDKANSPEKRSSLKRIRNWIIGR